MPWWVANDTTRPVARSKFTAWIVEPSRRTSSAAIRSAWRAATRAYLGFPVKRVAQGRIAMFIMLSTIVSASGP